MRGTKNSLVAVALLGGLALVVPPAVAQQSPTEPPEAGGFVALGPERVLDTRALDQPLGPGETLSVPLPVPADAEAVLISITSDVDATELSYITAWPTGTPQPDTSAINPTPGQVRSGAVLVGLGTDSSVSFFNYTGSVSLIVDLQGYTTALAPGVPGPAGPAGPVGPQGPTGPADPTATELVARFGSNAQPIETGTTEDPCTLGDVWLTASFLTPATPAEGQLLEIDTNVVLFTLIGPQFGGDGITTFALPDLRPVAPNGLTYVICTDGLPPSSP